MKRWTLVLAEVCIRPASKHDDAPATLSPSGRLGARARRRARRRRDAVSRAVRTANDANARARHIARDDVTTGRRNDARGSVCGVPRFELESRPAARARNPSTRPFRSFARPRVFTARDGLDRSIDRISERSSVSRSRRRRVRARARVRASGRPKRVLRREDSLRVSRILHRAPELLALELASKTQRVRVQAEFRVIGALPLGEMTE